MSYSFLQAGKQALTAAALALFVPIVAGCSGSSPLAPSLSAPAGSAGTSAVSRAGAYSFKTLDNPDDPSFNELLGINNLGKICGYYGSGSKSNPSVGYIVRKYGNSHYKTIMYPGAIDTVVSAVNNQNVIAGWYVSDSPSGTFGFIETADGLWSSYKDPHTKGSTNVTKIVGLSDSGLAVGYYTDSNKVPHAFELIQTTGQFHGIVPPGAVGTVATGINGKGDIVGYFTKGDGSTESFLLKGGVYTEFTYKGDATLAQSINWQDEIAGDYVDGSGNAHGFVLDNLLGTPQWTAPVDDPNAAGTTVIEGIQNHHYLVGYYVDGAGNTNGFLASPSAK